MRIRNIKNAKELVLSNELVVQKNPFIDNINIEIGCGKGDFIINMARNNPNENFIGIEKYESILLRALKKTEGLPSNLRFMCMDAIDLDQIFKSNINKIYLNFSDPWPKKRHIKRRLTNPIFLNIYNKISRENVHILMKTDNKDLFAYTLMTLNNNNYTFNNISLDLTNSDISNVLTEYENKFIKQGITINFVDAIKEVHK